MNAELNQKLAAVRQQLENSILNEAEEIGELDLPASIQKNITVLKAKLGLKVNAAWEGIHGYIVDFSVSGQTSHVWRLSADDFNLIAKTKGLRWVQMDAKKLTLGLE